MQHTFTIQQSDIVSQASVALHYTSAQVEAQGVQAQGSKAQGVQVPAEAVELPFIEADPEHLCERADLWRGVCTVLNQRLHPYGKAVEADGKLTVTLALPSNTGTGPDAVKQFCIAYMTAGVCAGWLGVVAPQLAQTFTGDAMTQLQLMDATLNSRRRPGASD